MRGTIVGIISNGRLLEQSVEVQCVLWTDVDCIMLMLHHITGFSESLGGAH